jgi:hypothetical protein
VKHQERAPSTTSGRPPPRAGALHHERAPLKHPSAKKGSTYTKPWVARLGVAGWGAVGWGAAAVAGKGAAGVASKDAGWGAVAVA